MTREFLPFPSISRLSREIVVTEKIDGTNAQILVTETGEVLAGSRTRWITPEDDNFGFARWVYENRGVLLEELGVGQHYGEWWGAGIQRRYGLKEKRFSLFNVTRWADAPRTLCHVVPVLYRGPFDTAAIDGALASLAAEGSRAAPGFNQPEGVVVFHSPSGSLFKKTLDKNDGHKGAH
jgi:hypothetical protein